MRKGALLMSIMALLAASCATDSVSTTTASASPNPTPTTATTTAGMTTGPTPVVVDYSPTVSDLGGLMYLLAHPDVEVLAISLPVTGEAGCDPGVQLTLGVLALVGQDHVPVACDPERPAHAEEWPAEFVDGALRMFSGIPKPIPEEGGPTGTELIISAVSGSDRPVTLWAVGPLTNVARALKRSPAIADNIRHIVIMGGAVDVAGNVFDSPAEWNLYIDSAAAADVVSSGVPITLVPLDATNDVPVPGWLPTALDRVEQSDEVVYLSRLVRAFETATSGFYYMWDELAAAVLTDAIEVHTERVNLSVVVDGPNSGQTFRDDGGSPVTLATGVRSPDQFYSDFVSIVAGSPFERDQATAEEEAYLLAVAESLKEFGDALEATFAPGSPFDSEEYDRNAVADALARVFDGMEATSSKVEQLEPPASLADLHSAYLDEVNADLALRDVVLEGLSAADTWDEAFALFADFSDGSACEAVAGEAFFLGVEAEFPCNP